MVSDARATVVGTGNSMHTHMEVWYNATCLKPTPRKTHRFQFAVKHKIVIMTFKAWDMYISIKQLYTPALCAGHQDPQQAQQVPLP